MQGAAAAIDWKQVWKTEIKPRADKRYYTKKKSNQRYYTKSQVTSLLTPYVDTTELVGALAGYYTKAQSDANYYTKTQSDTNYYTKAQGDAKYAPIPRLIRGAYMVLSVSPRGPPQGPSATPTALSAPPTVTSSRPERPPDVACPGTTAVPTATAGNLCIYERFLSGEYNACDDHQRRPGGQCQQRLWCLHPRASRQQRGTSRRPASWAVRPVALVVQHQALHPRVQPSAAPRTLVEAGVAGGRLGLPATRVTRHGEPGPAVR